MTSKGLREVMDHLLTKGAVMISTFSARGSNFPYDNAALVFLSDLYSFTKSLVKRLAILLTAIVARKEPKC